MTLAEFRAETAALPGTTEVVVLTPWGDIKPAARVERDDLDPEDPAYDQIAPGTIVLTGAAG